MPAKKPAKAPSPAPKEVKKASTATPKEVLEVSAATAAAAAAPSSKRRVTRYFARVLEAAASGAVGVPQHTTSSAKSTLTSPKKTVQSAGPPRISQRSTKEDLEKQTVPQLRSYLEKEGISKFIRTKSELVKLVLQSFTADGRAKLQELKSTPAASAPEAAPEKPKKYATRGAARK